MGQRQRRRQHRVPDRAHAVAQKRYVGLGVRRASQPRREVAHPELGVARQLRMAGKVRLERRDERRERPPEEPADEDLGDVDAVGVIASLEDLADRQPTRGRALAENVSLGDVAVDGGAGRRRLWRRCAAGLFREGGVVLLDRVGRQRRGVRFHRLDGDAEAEALRQAEAPGPIEHRALQEHTAARRHFPAGRCRRRGEGGFARGRLRGEHLRGLRALLLRTAAAQAQLERPVLLRGQKVLRRQKRRRLGRHRTKRTLFLLQDDLAQATRGLRHRRDDDQEGVDGQIEPNLRTTSLTLRQPPLFLPLVLSPVGYKIETLAHGRHIQY